ncbi:MAG: flavodoxin family protein [Candidatus Omnitrophica bacterium]|nr:flavodoxin family protein [Candidatus Omnitrophota bacterium]
MKVAIVIHSMSGNTYLMGRAFADELKQLGAEVALLRVVDQDWVEKEGLSDAARQNVSAFRALPEATAASLEAADLIVMGCPTYFGNVTGKIKVFMDTTGGLWFHAKLAGKKFAAFTSAGNTEGGGDLCLQAFHTYAKYMGMLVVPCPVRILPGENVNVLGVIQYSSGKPAEILDDKTARLIRNMAAFLVAR